MAGGKGGQAQALKRARTWGPGSSGVLAFLCCNKSRNVKLEERKIYFGSLGPVAVGLWPGRASGGEHVEEQSCLPYSSQEAEQGGERKKPGGSPFKGMLLVTYLLQLGPSS